MRVMNVYSLLMSVLLIFFAGTESVFAQITDRARPKEWDQLVPGARFIDRFLPMPEGELSSHVWGAENVVPRYVDNGIEDSERSYWGGNILRGDDRLYHLYVCGWPESSSNGHAEWPRSTVYHAVCNNSIGPFVVRDTIGAGHNPEAFRLKDGRCVIYVIDGYYLADGVNGPWTYHTFEFDRRDRRIIEGLSNLTFAQREDKSYLMVCRGGGVWISQTGLSAYNQVTDKRVYPPVEGEFEDPVVWRDHVQYHLIVNDWLGRIAFYLRSGDGIKWVTDPGEAYLPGVSVHKDGRVEDWFKYERLKILQDEYGRAIQANFAVIDVLKNNDKGNDNHSSKNIGIPLNPGLLLTILNAKPITEKTKEIRLKIVAEEGFDPHADIDIASLRFGASSEVNYGRGCKVLATKKVGPDLVVTFDAQGNGITEDEFAPKLIGKTSSGEILYGYARLPSMDYNDPILSARIPVFTPEAKGMNLNMEIENFGQIESDKTTLKVICFIDGKKKEIGKAKVPAIKAYGKANVMLTCKPLFEKGKSYDFEIVIPVSASNVSIFGFQSIPVE